MKILVIAPHPDDEILGVGGTIARLIDEGKEVSVCIVTKGQEPMFSTVIIEKTRNEARRAHGYLGVKGTIFLDFPAASLETISRNELNSKILNVIQTIKPEIMFVPHYGDMQKDHQLVFESCMVAIRPKYEHVVSKVFAYETLSETEWNIQNVNNIFLPNVYFDITLYLENKIKALSFFETQLAEFPNARSLEAVEALAKYRGSSVNKKAAEAFQLVRSIN